MAAAPPRPSTRRHAIGRERFANLIAYWLRRSDVSLRHMSAITDWSLGEAGWLGSGPLSQLGRGLLVRPSVKTLDALACCNEAIWRWQTQGRDAAVLRYGSIVPWGIKAHWLDGAFWLPSPEEPEQPLNLGELADVLAGHLEVPYLPLALTPSDGRVMAQELCELMNGIATENGLSPIEAINRLAAAHPTKDERTRSLIRNLLFDEADLTSDQMVEELGGLAEMIRVIRQQPAGEYGPSELRAELLAARRRT